MITYAKTVPPLFISFDEVRLGLEIELNPTLTQIFWFDCVRFPNQSNPIVRLSSISFVRALGIPKENWG